MSRSLRSRLIGLLASSAVVFSVLVPGAAFADEPTPSPTPTVEPTAEPTAEPTQDPTAEPTAEPSATPEPSETATPTPTPTPTAAAATTVTLTGVFTWLSSEDRMAGDAPDAASGDSSVIFTVPGSGFLRADVSQLPTDIASGTVNVRFAVPAGLTLSSDEAAAFQQLALYSTGTAPLVAQSVTAGRGVAQRATPYVNQTPNTPAVHEIYAVLVTPNGGGKGADQTQAGVAASVVGTNDYWSQQSSGSVQFHLAGTTTWYSSANSCATDAGSTALWNQAATVAASQLGYVAARNVHLVLFFPSSYFTSCGGAVGLGTIGWSANEGGAAWVIGTGASGSNAAIAQGILSHELGHNLSFGHANWAQCPGTEPAFNNDHLLDDCSLQSYGDAVDVMAYSQNGRTGGALSSAQAIRGNLWPASDYENAPVGTTEYTLNAVSTNAGLRSVVVEDPYGGDRFFIEFRNNTGEDAPYAGAGCNASLCVANAPGVRVLRFDDDYRFIGFPGDDSYLLGRAGPGGSTLINYVAGQTFKAEGSAFGSNPQVKVEVVSISGNTATVRVTRPPLGGSPTSQLVRTDFVSIVPTVTYDSRLRVGDVWTANLGSYWSAESYSFQWYRNNVPIGGATGSSYTIAAADLGKSIRVSVTGSSTGAASATRSDPDDGTGYGPIVKGIYRSDLPGSIAVDNTGDPLTAVVADWPSGTTFAYQWLRGATAATATTAVGSGGSTYALTAADVGQFVRVRVTATPPGFEAVTRYSVAANYSVASSGALTVSGAPVVGLPLTVSNLLAYVGQGHAVTPTSFDYQWLRNGVAIASATNDTYTLVPADFGAKVSVRVVAYTPGYAPNTATSAQTAAIGKGTLTGTFAIPEVTKAATPAGGTLTAGLPVGSIDTPDVTNAYQWFRGAVAIAGAAAASYSLTSADYGQLISVKVTVSKLNYNSLTLQSTPINYSVIPSVATPAITGELRVGAPLTVTDREYVADGVTTSAVESIQWYRSGVAITGSLGTGATYLVVAADLGKVLTARVTASVDGFLPAIGTSTPTQPVGTNSFDGWNAQEYASVSIAPLTNTLTVTGTGITGPGIPTVAYQWYRGTAAVAGAIKATYALTAADYGQPVWVRVTTSRAGFTTIVKDSTKVDYSITGPTPLLYSTAAPFRVGMTYSVDPAVFSSKDGDLPVVPAFQWFRNGVAIAGATADSYVSVSADFGTKLSVRVTAAWPGYVSKVTMSSASATLLVGLIEGSLEAPVVTAAPTGVLTATLPVGSVTTPSATVSWQWYRGGGAVAGATSPNYALSAIDYGMGIYVRAIVSKLNYTTAAPLYSALGSYGVNAADRPSLTDFGTPPKTGDTLGIGLPSYTNWGGEPLAAVVTYQWLRNGAAISGATQPSYVVQSADFGTTVTARVTASAPGYVAKVDTTPTRGLVVKGTLTTDGSKPIVAASTAGVLSVTIPTGAVSQSSSTLAYQWVRNGVAIVGAAGATYTLTAADSGKLISVRVSASKLNFLPVPNLPLAESDGVNYSISAAADLATPVAYTIQGDPKVSETLSVALPDYFTREGAVTPTLAYQWFRGTTLIAGATQPTYVVQSVDFGLKLQVRVTASTPRAIPNIVLSPFTAAVVTGEIKGFGTPTVSTSATGKLTVVVPTSAPTTPGVTYTYQWMRGTAPIAGATISTFPLTAADFGKVIWVKVTISKLNGGSVLLPSVETDYSIAADAVPSILETPTVGEVLSVTLPNYSTLGIPATPVLAYAWLRNGVAIAGATAATYLVQPADFTTKITVRVTATVPGYVASILTSATPGTTTLVGSLHDFGTPVVSQATTGKLTATVPTTSATTPGATYAFQWFRGTTAIVGAITSTFQLSSLDANRPISVRVTISKLNSGEPLVTTSAETNYSVQTTTPDALPEITGISQVSELLSVTLPDYSTYSGSVTPTFTYAWLRNDVAIAGATGATYLLQPADVNTRTSVRVTASVPGFVASTLTSAKVGPAAVGTLKDFGTPIVTTSLAGKLTATVPTVSTTTPGATLAYQWLRDGAVIAGATATTFPLTSLDSGKLISVRVTISKASSGLPLVLVSTPTNFSVTADGGTLPGVDGLLQVGQTLSVALPTYSALESPVTPTFSYVWLRNNVAIPGATAATYVVASSDDNSTFSVRVTATVPGYVALIATSPQTVAIQKGYLEVSVSGPTVTRSATGLLTASVPSNWIVTPATTTTYQWLRDGVVVPGATLKTYQLGAADAGAAIVVRFTVTKANMVNSPEARTSDPVSYTVIPSSPLVISGDARVGETLTAFAPGFSTPDGPAAFTVAYQWFRNTVAIAGATGASYLILPTDLNARISVRVTGTVPGWVASVRTSSQTDPVATGVLDLGTEPPLVVASATGLLTASLPTIVSLGVTPTYQWLRGDVAIAGATTNKYQLLATDSGKLISVKVTVSKANVVPLTDFRTSVGVDYGILAAKPSISGTANVGVRLSTVLPAYTINGTTATPVVAYQWLRAGVAIAGATLSYYDTVLADLGKTITVRVTATQPGALGLVQTSDPTAALQPGVFGGTPTPVVTGSSAAVLSASLPAGIPETGLTLAYQWLRNGTAITGATAVTYALDPIADYNTLTSVRVTVSKAGYISLPLESTPTDYSIHATGDVVIDNTVTTEGATISLASTPSYARGADFWVPAPSDFTYQWYLNGVAVAGAAGIGESYTVLAANAGKVLTVRVTVRSPGYLPVSSLSGFVVLGAP